MEPRLLALLASFSYLQLEKLTEETTLVLESINELMRIIGSKKVTKWKNKIISILRYEVVFSTALGKAVTLHGSANCAHKFT